MNSRYLIFGLVASVTVNLVLVGFVIGRASDVQLRPPPADYSHGIRNLFGNMPDARRAQLDDHFREYFTTLRPRFREMRNAQAELRTAISTDPLDTETLAATMATFTRHLCESQARSHEPFVSLIAVLTPEERRQLIVRMGPTGRLRPDGRPRPDGRLRLNDRQRSGNRHPPPG